MSRRKNKKRTFTASSKRSGEVSIAQNHCTEEELSQAIASAIFEAEKRAKEENEKKRKKQLDWWKEQIGLPKEDVSGWKGFFQSLRCPFRIVKLSFAPRKVVEGTQCIEHFLITTIHLFFMFIQLVLYLLMGYIPFQVIIVRQEMSLYTVIAVLFALMLFVLARMVEVMSFELYELKERDVIFSLFSCIVSLLSFGVAVAAFAVT